MGHFAANYMLTNNLVYGGYSKWVTAISTINVYSSFSVSLLSCYGLWSLVHSNFLWWKRVRHDYWEHHFDAKDGNNSPTWSKLHSIYFACPSLVTISFQIIFHRFMSLHPHQSSGIIEKSENKPKPINPLNYSGGSLKFYASKCLICRNTTHWPLSHTTSRST